MVRGTGLEPVSTLRQPPFQALRALKTGPLPFYRLASSASGGASAINPMHVKQQAQWRKGGFCNRMADFKPSTAFCMLPMVAWE